ncbi:MAG TPA: NAD(P)H-hydrate dehydratase [Myxococcales bacterium]|nr:NAD(P)H-hydrate dehydratase [Myxococcales bacterium]
MPRLLTAAEVRSLDRLASEKYGVPVAALMESAGRAVAEAAWPRCATGRVVVFAGGGNNGGDGFVAARALRERGLSVDLWLAVPAEKLHGEAKANFEKLRALGVEVVDDGPPAARRGDVTVDALLGTGLSRAPEGRVAEGIRAVNAGRAAGARVIAVDVPSGLPSDGGPPPGDCVAASLTVTFVAPKLGLALEPGASLAGELVVADIGLPAAALAELPPGPSLLDEGEVRRLFPPRARDSHKGTYGHLLVVAGSPGKAGAAALAVAGALRGGAGLVTLASREAVASALWQLRPEAMAVALPWAGPLGTLDIEPLAAAAAGKSALAIGPGIPRGPDTARALSMVLAGFEGPAVLDADALNAFAEDLELLRAARGPLVVTPHPGEMARLCGRTTAEVQRDRLGVARAFATERAVTVVLKGARTVVAAADGRVWIVPTGNPGMATGGTGDVLCGLIGALLAQGLAPAEAAYGGAFVHGLAGDFATRRRGERGLVAGDVAEAVAEVWAAWRS